MFKGFDRHEILKAHYLNEIKQWNWKGIVAGLELSKDEDNELILSNWIGTVTGLTPSGKIYTFWTSNQTRSDEARDAAWNEALEEVAEENDGFIWTWEDSFYFQAHPSFKVETWFERDRQHVALEEEKTGQTLIDLWDEEVTEHVEQGFLDPKDYEGSLLEMLSERL